MNDLSGIGPAARDQRREAEPFLDFRATPVDNGAWQIAILSPKAQQWVRKHPKAAVLSRQGNAIRTDIRGLNLVLCEARIEGLRTQYVGPLQAVVL